MREEIVPELKKLTDAIHAEGAKASIQLGHCGNMTHRATCGCMPVGASRGFNLKKVPDINDLMKENKELTNNWNELEEWIKEMSMGTYEYNPYDEMRDKMKEISGRNDKERNLEKH